MSPDSAPAPLWPPPSGDLRASGNEVHVWRVRLDAHFCLPCGEGLLSSEEKNRAAKFKFDRDRRRYVVAHAGLRSVLSTYLGLTPGQLMFVAGPNGKPGLGRGSVREFVHFNLSHSNEIALIAIAGGKEVGVDVEWMERRLPFRDIAGRFFSAAEVAALDSLPGDLQKIAFFKCWTAKEAFLKAKGTGLGGKLDEVEIRFTHGQGVRIEARVPNWSLAGLEPGDGSAGAVVVEGGECKIRLYLWPGLKNACPHARA